MSTSALFEERSRQFAAWGIPDSLVASARESISTMWGTGPGTWVEAWAGLARTAERSGDPLLAAQLWGAARFPSLATDERMEAHHEQLRCYLRAAPRFPVLFRRHTVELTAAGDAGGTTKLPVHEFSRRGRRRPGVLIMSGGVDTWKVEIHRMAMATAKVTGLKVVAVDMAGTGENPLPLAPDSDAQLRSLVGLLRSEHPGEPVLYFGLSFGGHWAVKLALQNSVDAAVDIGGPTGAAGEQLNPLSMPYGMAGIAGNAMHLDRLPDAGTAAELLDGFSLRRQGLLDARGGAPLLAVNGDSDQYVPLGDTAELAGRPGTSVWIVRDATHCATEHFRPVLLGTWGWMRARTGGGRLLEGAMRIPSRRRVDVRT
ncbi:alpha/beta hydrolase [Streptomyces rubiginosohelvolus]|uniref:alpha/beta hydrolase n=1 Tax=Streptomyces rubiginosohelvolus TaxID=67362 RepID=UPI003662FFA6